MDDLMLKRLKEQLLRAERIGDRLAIIVLKSKIKAEIAARTRRALEV